jgi:hypothetical protein
MAAVVFKAFNEVYRSGVSKSGQLWQYQRDHRHGQDAQPHGGGRGRRDHRQQTFLREQACDEMQGYYFSKPIVADEFAALLRDNLAS